MKGTEHRLMTDAEVCDLLRIQPGTLRKLLREGPPRKRNRNAGDLRLVKRILVGGQRRWLRESVEQFITE